MAFQFGTVLSMLEKIINEIFFVELVSKLHQSDTLKIINAILIRRISRESLKDLGPFHPASFHTFSRLLDNSYHTCVYNSFFFLFQYGEQYDEEVMNYILQKIEEQKNVETSLEKVEMFWSVYGFENLLQKYNIDQHNCVDFISNILFYFVFLKW